MSTMRALVTFAFFLSLALDEVRAQSIQVLPYQHTHRFDGIGSGVTLYPAHLTQGTNSTRREQAYDWLFKDLHHEIVRISFNDPSEPVNDNNDPSTLNLSAFKFGNVGEGVMANAARKRDPGVKLMAWAQDIPLWLRRTVNGKDRPDYSNPNLYPEIAEWIFANLIDFKVNKGLDVEYVDIANEPDFNGFYGRTGTQELLLKMVPFLRTLVAKQGAKYGVTMPQIVAPSCLGTGSARSYLEYYRTNVSAAFANIDVVSTHQYGAGFNSGNFAAIDALKGGRGFIMNEMHPQHRSVLNNPAHLPEDSVPDELEAALLFGGLFATAIHNGASSWVYFLSNAPSNGAVALIRTPWGGTPSRRKNYFAVRQMTSLQSRRADVVRRTVSKLPAGYDVVAFHKWGEKRAFVHIVNRGSSEVTVNLELNNNGGGRIPLARVVDRVTDATSNIRVVQDLKYPTNVPAYAVAMKKHSIRTIELHFGDQTKGGVPIGETIWLRSAANHRYVATDTTASNKPVRGETHAPAADHRFVVTDGPSGNVHLVSMQTGLHVRADLSGSAKTLHADSLDRGSWKQFGWVSLGGGQVALRQVSNRRFVRVDENASGTPLRADASSTVPAARFVWGTGPMASFEPFGSACKGSWGTPMLTGANVPVLGTTLRVTGRNTPLGATVLGAVGGIPLDLDLRPLGAAGCRLYTDPIAVQPIPTLLGTFTWSLPIPNDVRIAGIPAILQCFVVDKAANAMGGTTTNAGRVRAGL